MRVQLLMQRLLVKPVLWFSARFSSKPEPSRIYAALTALLDCIGKGEKKKGLVINFEKATGKFIIFSDQHKGARNGADDFMLCEPNYLAALDYYYQNGFHYIALGDCEELWENTLTAVKKEQGPSFRKEGQFIPGNAFIKIFGNHDLQWGNDPFAPAQLKDIFGYEVPIYEGVVLRTTVNNKQFDIFCTHGHQGDKVSDGNWLSKFFVSRVWAPLQAYLKINPNTPAYNAHLKTLHNTIMYQWSAQQKDMLLVTGHTHQPVFESLTHIERLYRQLLFARQQHDAETIKWLEHEIEVRKFVYNNVSEDYLKLKPSYFNSGCCCFSDGAISGLELSEGVLRLVEWQVKDNVPTRMVLEEAPLEELQLGIAAK